MKNLILFLLISVSLFGQRKPSDIVDVNNFDYVYAEKLLHDKFVTELSKMFNDSGSLTKDSIAYKAIEYQLSHFKNGGKFGHTNTEVFRNKLLINPWDRVTFFMGYNSNYVSEVLCKLPIIYDTTDISKIQWYVEDSFNNFIKTNRITDNRKYWYYDSKNKSFVYEELNPLHIKMITYEYLINEVYDAFIFQSPPHSSEIKYAYTNNFKCFWKIDIKKRNNNSFFISSGSVFYKTKTKEQLDYEIKYTKK